MGEFEYIRWIRGRTPASPQIPVGPGDDCAVSGSDANRGWLVTTDMLLEGRHFVLADIGPHHIGRKAMAVNLSDIAAMGGKPIAAFVSVGLPLGDRRSGRARAIPRHARDGRSIRDGHRRRGHQYLDRRPGRVGHRDRQAGAAGPILPGGQAGGLAASSPAPLGGSILGKHLDFTPRIRGRR